MSNINNLTIVGRLTADPEVKATQGGANMTLFSIASNRTWKTKEGEKREEVSFFRCVAWNKFPGEVIAQYCKKGQRIGITGRIQQQRWEDDKGNKRDAVNIVVENFEFLNSEKSNGAPLPESQGDDKGQYKQEQNEPEQAPSFDGGFPADPESAPSHFSDEDIPF